jgi:DNA-binding transcriptional LysR family regulator
MRAGSKRISTLRVMICRRCARAAAASSVLGHRVSRLLERMPRAQVRLVESTMNQLMPQLARGELDIVVGRSGQQYDDPRLQTETLYTEPINFVARPDHPLTEKAKPDLDDVLAYSWIVWPQGTPVRNALETALAAAGRALPNHCVESNSSILNLTLLNNTDLVGIASHRAALRFEQLNALRILPVQLEGFGSVSVYWHAENINRAAVAMALECLRAFADPHMKEWHTA